MLVAGNESPAVGLTGNLRVDLFGLRDMKAEPQVQDQTAGGLPLQHKSPWLAAGMSIAIPGAGEFYAGSYWKAAAFVAVDIAAWVFAYMYDHKGDQQTDRFQDFANIHWSVVQYAQYAQTLAPAGNTYAWRIPGTESRSPWDKPWQQVNWTELNRMERDIGTYYSHVLPAYNDQQYYELIGKYPQFNQGWDDAGPAFNYGDPLTGRFLFYSGERGKANDFYAKATTFVTVALVNHVLSAIDAAWSAASFNNAVHAQVGVQSVPTETGVSQVPILRMQFYF